MSRKGNSRHIKRLAMSTFLGVPRKEAKFIVKPSPGRHDLGRSIALSSLLRDKLGYATNMKEAERIIRQGKVKVNGKVVKDTKFAVGYGDIVSLASGEHYKVAINNQGAVALEKAEADAKRISKVIDKYVAKGGKLMIRLHDGTIAAAPSKEIKVNDSVAIGSDGKIEKVLKFGVGVECIVYKGRHPNKRGKVVSITEGTASRPMMVELATDSGSIKTVIDNIMVVGE
ncbi:MAG: S4 domain-containing protein [Candidatus Micrarchaeia archaeon]|jgi:small subunit ribosomal protein S4e